MPSARLGGALFDLDGTLLDTSGDFIHVVGELLADAKRAPVADERIRAAISGGSWTLIDVAFGIDRQHAEYEALRQELLRRYGEVLGEHATFFAGIEELLTTLADAGLIWGVVTNKPARFAMPLMEKLGMGDIATICPEHVGCGKPAPDGVLEACRRLDASPATVIFIGDDRRDIEAGRAAGTRTAAALWGFSTAAEAVGWEADWNFETPQAAREQIRRLIAKSP